MKFKKSQIGKWFHLNTTVAEVCQLLDISGSGDITVDAYPLTSSCWEGVRNLLAIEDVKRVVVKQERAAKLDVTFYNGVIEACQATIKKGNAMWNIKYANETGCVPKDMEPLLNEWTANTVCQGPDSEWTSGNVLYADYRQFVECRNETPVPQDAWGRYMTERFGKRNRKAGNFHLVTRLKELKNAA